MKTGPVETANDRQVGGYHYKTKTIQPWDFIVANDIGFLEGNAIKYLSRWKQKNGLEDLQKALHYVQKAIEVEEARLEAEMVRELSDVSVTFAGGGGGGGSGAGAGIGRGVIGKMVDAFKLKPTEGQ